MANRPGIPNAWPFAIWVIALSVLAGCGSRTGLADATAGAGPRPDARCVDPAPTCVEAAADPCGPSLTVSPSCVGDVWRCPAGARVYGRAVGTGAPCLPFHDPSTGVARLGPWGLASIVRVPTDDGRCLWIADHAILSNGSTQYNVAFEPDPGAPFGSCPERSLMPPTPIVTVEGTPDPSLLVQILGAYRLGGATHVLYRRFRVDQNATYGVTELEGGMARWDGPTGRIVVPALGSPSPWGLDLDLGDAMTAAGDGAHEYVWGCGLHSGNNGRGCALSRVDAGDRVQLLSTGSQWIDSVAGAEASVLFDSGPWISSVLPTSAGFEHVYAGNFGRALQRHVANAVIGPWSDGPDLAPCDLPASDTNAYCAGPVVHAEMADPTRPGELPVTYGIGSTGAQGARGEDYWPRLVWVE